QPIEQLASLRGTPNMSVWRPADAVESAVAWLSALQKNNGPSSLVFSRQNLAHLERDALQLDNISRGAYTLVEETGVLEAIIIATGSEVELAVKAQQALTAQGKGVRVVSMPCVDVFMAQDAVYRNKVLPPEVRARVAVEASHADYWYKFVGLDGKVIGMTTFGESAPIKDLYQHFGITVDAVVNAVNSLS
ncbi:MAG: transketolase, partial [Moraxellaceae bacterium]|nr:transketolase [Moraxellaceae bacterium]